MDLCRRGFDYWVDHNQGAHNGFIELIEAGDCFILPQIVCCDPDRTSVAELSRGAHCSQK